MKAQEVWEAWEKDKSLMFKCNIGKIYYNNITLTPYWEDHLMPVDLLTFMRKDWYPVEEWRECTFLEAIEAWVNGSKIKSFYDGNEYIYQSEFLWTKDKLQTLDIYEARTYKWYIKE